MLQGFANGGWLLLQNCHLSLDYVVEVLDQILESESVHDEFRLWVTSEVHKKFPISFLQVTHKTTLYTECSIIWVGNAHESLTDEISHTALNTV